MPRVTRTNRPPAWDWSPVLAAEADLRARGYPGPDDPRVWMDDAHNEYAPVLKGKKCAWESSMDPRKMTKLYPHEAFPIADNLFDPWKFAYMVRTITHAYRIQFPCCVVVRARLVTEQDVIETSEYGGTGEPYVETVDRTGLPWAMPIPGAHFRPEHVGKRMAQVRNGNHRCFAAFAAGEPFVWAKLQEDG